MILLLSSPLSQLRAGKTDRFYQAVPQLGHRHPIQITQAGKARPLQLPQSALARDLGEFTPLPAASRHVAYSLDLHVRGRVHRELHPPPHRALLARRMAQPVPVRYGIRRARESLHRQQHALVFHWHSNATRYAPCTQLFSLWSLSTSSRSLTSATVCMCVCVGNEIFTTGDTSSSGNVTGSGRLLR